MLPRFCWLLPNHDYPELLVEMEAMGTALQDQDASVEMNVIPNRDHYSIVTRIGTPDDPTTELMLRWLEKVLDFSAVESE